MLGGVGGGTQRATVLIRLARRWSPVGTARLEVDAASGMKMLHLELTALAQDLYIPVGELPGLAESIESDEELVLSATTVGHA